MKEKKRKKKKMHKYVATCCGWSPSLKSTSWPPWLWQWLLEPVKRGYGAEFKILRKLLKVYCLRGAMGIVWLLGLFMGVLQASSRGEGAVDAAVAQLAALHLDQVTVYMTCN